MTNRANQIGTREWVEENNRRVIFQNHMYKCAGRDNPEHEKHGLFTGLWEDFCLKEAGFALRDQWFERMQFVQDVKEGKIKPNARYNVADLGKILNIDVSDKQVRSFLTGDLKKLGVISSTSGKEKIKNYKLSDVVNKLIEKSKTKKVKGQAIADTERLKIVSKIDPELNKLINNTNSRLRTIANETGLASPDLFNKSKGSRTWG